MPVHLIAFSGSTRSASYNLMLVEIAAGAAERAGATVERINLRDFDLPVYDADHELEHGMPAGVMKLKAICAAADGYLVSAPEYNGSLSAVLKNAIDWVSRPTPGTAETQLSLTSYRGKVAGIMSASPGAWGGVRGLAHVRQILSSLGVLVVAEQLAVPRVTDAFDADGNLRDPAYQNIVETIGARTVQLARAFKTA